MVHKTPWPLCVLLPHTYTQDGWFLQPQCWSDPLSRVYVSGSVNDHVSRRITTLKSKVQRRTTNCRCRCSRIQTVFPYTYSYSTHRFTKESTPIEVMSLSTTSEELVFVWVWVWDWVHTSSFSYTPSQVPLLLDTLLSHNIPFPGLHYCHCVWWSSFLDFGASLHMTLLVPDSGWLFYALTSWLWLGCCDDFDTLMMMTIMTRHRGHHSTSIDKKGWTRRNTRVSVGHL